MAGLRKDVELIFRGEDRASPTIKNVRKAVEGLSKGIDDQIRAAERGEGSIDELAKAYRSLKDAQGDVSEIVKLAAAYEKQTTALAEQSKKVEEAKAKQEGLAAQIAATERPTKRLIAAQEAAERQLAGAIQKQDQLQAAVRETGAALDAAGGDSRDFAATQDRIRQAAIETARAIRDAAAALDQFKGKQASGKANIAAQEEALAFNQMAAGSGLPEAQIAFISQLENRMEALGQAIREDQASMAALNRELADRAAADAALRVRSMTQALDEADAAAARLKASAQFRQIASEIEAGARDISRFGTATDTAAISAQRLADAVQAIINPTQAAANNIGKVSTILDQAEASLEGNKRRISEYNDELNNLGAAGAGLANMARLIDQFRQQEAAVMSAARQMDAAQAEVLSLATAIRTADAPTAEMVTSLQQAESALERLGAAHQKEVTKLKQMESGLESAGIDVRNLDAAQEQLINSSNRLAAAQQKITNMTRGRGNFLGLNSAELTQLGYQINDIVVSLASGQNPLMVLTQQGAQIGQIIPGAFAKIVRFTPLIAGLTAVILPFAAALNKASTEAANLKMGEGLVAQMGAGVGTTAQEFANLAGSLEKAGIKADEVREKLVQLAADGLSTAQMQDYIATAKAVAEVTGVEMAEALEQVREHFQGGMDDIIALNEETGAFTNTQLDMIQSLYDQGKADEARTLALSIYQGKMQEVADAQRGPWKIAVEQLSQAWSNFIGWLSRTDYIQNVRKNLESLGQTAAFVGALLNQISQGKFDPAAAQKIAMGARAPAGGGGGAPDPNRRTAGGRQLLGERDRELRQVKATTRAQREALVVEDARREAAARGLSTREVELYTAKSLAVFNAKEDQAQAKRDAAAAKRGARAGKSREAAARRAARAAEAEQNRIENMEEALVRSLESLDSKVAKNSTESLEIRLSAIDSEYKKLFRNIEEYSAKTGGKGMIGGRTIAEAKAHVDLQKQALKNYETMEFYEKRIGDLEKDRKEKLDLIADQVARGIITPEQGLTQSNAVIDDMAKKINEMAVLALAFAQGIRGATPDPKLEALISKMQAVAQNNSGGQNVRSKQELAQGAIDKQMSDLNELIEHRTTLIAHENALVELGLQTRNEAEAKIQTHYATTTGLIQQQIAAIRAMKAAYGSELTPEMDRYFQRLEAGLQMAELQTTYVDSRFTELKNGINQIIGSNIISFIDTLAQSFAELTTGKGDVMDFFASIGMAFLDMIAKTLQGIAMLIIQAIILDAVDKMTGGLIKPLLKLYGGASVFHEGGVVGDNGSSSRTRQVNPLIFAGAPRYHSGGIAGLAPDEMGAVLRKGEEVITEADPRHRSNGGMSPAGVGGATGIRQVLAIGDDEIAGAMAGAAGEQTVISHIRRNKASIKQMLESR